MRVYFIAVLLGLPVFSLAGVGFADGNQYYIDTYEGSVTITCEDYNNRNGRRPNRVTRYFDCHEEYISPTTFSYFNGPDGVTAEKIQLHAVWENGKSESKSYDYSNKRGRTNSRVNLFTRTLLQKPLLGIGANQVNWACLDKEDKVVTSGQFETNLDYGKQVTCRHEYIYSNFDSDCDFRSRACEQYFRRARDCREH